MKHIKLFEQFINESDAYSISRMADNIGTGPAQEFLDKHNVDIKLIAKDITLGNINKYELRDVVRGNAPASKIKKFLKTYITESIINEGLSSAEKKKFLGFFEKAEGKQCRVTVGEWSGTVTEEGKLEKSEYGMYKVSDGDMWIEPDYLVTAGIKIKTLSAKKLVYVYDSDWTIEILK